MLLNALVGLVLGGFDIPKTEKLNTVPAASGLLEKVRLTFIPVEPTFVQVTELSWDTEVHERVPSVTS